ncbi:hypothetical protein HD806DRAFT_116538 [Xylariaceae sp. AK1471]|nr:hypothetical protein HD806DRAFT_116538 [Xylariaceae sp. AK1471]
METTLILPSPAAGENSKCTRHSYAHNPPSSLRLAKEGQKPVIDLPDEDPITVEIVLYYLYHQKYYIPQQATSAEQIHQDGISETLTPEHSISTDATTLNEMTADSASLEPGPRSMSADLALHMAIYALARKCSIQRLQTLALRKFKEVATKCWDSDDFL